MREERDEGAGSDPQRRVPFWRRRPGTTMGVAALLLGLAVAAVVALQSCVTVACPAIGFVPGLEVRLQGTDSAVARVATIRVCVDDECSGPAIGAGPSVAAFVSLAPPEAPDCSAYAQPSPSPWAGGARLIEGPLPAGCLPHGATVAAEPSSYPPTSALPGISASPRPEASSIPAIGVRKEDARTWSVIFYAIDEPDRLTVAALDTGGAELASVDAPLQWREREPLSPCPSGIETDPIELGIPG